MDTLEAYLVARGWPSPRGLTAGILSVFVAQVLTLVYYAAMRFIVRSPNSQVKVFCPCLPCPHCQPPPDTSLASELWGHISAPGSFAMLVTYLCVTWMLRIMPESYYDLEAPVSWLHVAFQFVVVDFWTFVAHLFEHYWTAYYVRSHKAHHVFRRPKLFHAFTGSIGDTSTLILAPLAITAQVCHVSCASYIAFGTLYATQFTLIHCEFSHPWERALSMLGIGTSLDHNVHHALFIYNYSHFFTWWDRLCGTYKSPYDTSIFQLEGK